MKSESSNFSSEPPASPPINRRRFLATQLGAACSIASISLTPGCNQQGKDRPIPQSREEALKLARQLQQKFPLIDGHNDLPWQIRKEKDLAMRHIDLNNPPSHFHTSIPRLREGLVGGQFWVAYPQFKHEPKTALVHTLEAIDLIKRFVAAYPKDLELVRTAAEARQAFKRGKVASFICVEGGQAITDSLGVLRIFHQLGARYMTLTHNATHSWADSATDQARHQGLSDFGVEVVQEMNRLGMVVDLSHVSPQVMHQALEISKSPVAFTHSNAHSLAPHPRNVPDDVLAKVSANGGVVMATAVPQFSTKPFAEYAVELMQRIDDAEAQNDQPLTNRQISTLRREFEAANPKPQSTLSDYADHIDYLVKKVGIDHVGIGSDFDGIRDVPVGFEHVGKFPHLTAELLLRGYNDQELEKILGGNILRVLETNEQRAQNS